MDASRICLSCRKPLDSGAVQGFCPECLIQAGFDTGRPPDPASAAADSEAKPGFEPPGLEEIARLFPQLEITGLIGRGGMGAVYKARQPALDRWVALKVLPLQAMTGVDFAERFNREARALARLNHPNIVAVYDFGQAGALHYFIMEYVEGASLRQLLRVGRLSPREALQIVPQVCDALQYAHDEGVVHRDIKPENVLVNRKGRVKIADFGVAKILSRDPETLRLTREGQVLGTPHYMAPEQVEHPLAVDHRADIYSLGVVFYELLTGELPLGRFQPPSQRVPGDARLDEVVLRALEKEPERRYQQASQVKNDVETIATTPPSGGLASPPAQAPDLPASNPAAALPPGGGALGTARPTSRASVPASPTIRPLWITIARWTARVLGTLLLAAFLIMVLMEGMMPVVGLGTREQLASAAWGLALLGFALGWKFEGTAALLIALGWALFPLAQGLQPRPYLSPLPFYGVVAALYGFCWWASHGRKTWIVAGAVAGVLAVLTLSFLLVPGFTNRPRIPARDPQTGRNLIDLTPHYNAALADNWMDPQDPRDTLAELPTGLQLLAGTQFDIRGLIQVERECRKHPPQVNDIAIRQRCQRVHFLHAARNAALVEDGLDIGRYVVHFAGGERREIPLVLGRELVDWHIQRRQTEAYVTAWAGANPKSRKMRKEIRLFKSTWENPLPGVEIQTVDFVATCTGPCPFLVALTVE